MGHHRCDRFTPLLQVIPQQLSFLSLKPEIRRSLMQAVTQMLWSALHLGMPVQGLQ